jgi:hypothetical protein
MRRRHIFNMPKNIILIIGLLSCVVACTSVCVYIVPNAEGKYIVTATAENEFKANQLVANKAQGICTQRGLRVDVIHQEAIYQGLDKDQQKLIKSAHDVLPKSKTAGTFFPKNHNYRSTIIFKCSR